MHYNRPRLRRGFVQAAKRRAARQHKVGLRLRRRAIHYRNIGSVKDRPHLAVSS